jgi:hypothetical protein
MSPTIVIHRGRPELVAGGSGGPTIVSGVLQVMLGVTAFGLDAPAAVAAPRIHDQAVPPGLAVEPGIEATARAALVRVGHRLREATALGAVSAIAVAADGTISAAGDARKDGGAELVPPPGDAGPGPGDAVRLGSPAPARARRAELDGSGVLPSRSSRATTRDSRDQPLRTPRR